MAMHGCPPELDPTSIANHSAARRRFLGAALSITAVVGSLLVAGAAHAHPVTTGSLTFTGHSYSTSNGDVFSVVGDTDGVNVGLRAHNGDWWSLEFDAPDEPTAGTPAALAPGSYSGAHRAGFNGTGPGLDLSGNGLGCNEVTGSFTITKAEFGYARYVQAFDATFEQHCDGGPATLGEVHIANPPEPAGSSPPPGSSPPSASMPPRAIGSLTFSGDAGDYISQGRTWSYATSKGDELDFSGGPGAVHVSVNAYNGNSWHLDIVAPKAGSGQPSFLARGTYTGAQLPRAAGDAPGLELSGEGRACDQLNGSFTITNAAFAVARGDAQTFDATFEWRCDGRVAGARGEVHISVPPLQTGSGQSSSYANDASKDSDRASLSLMGVGIGAGIVLVVLVALVVALTVRRRHRSRSSTGGAV